MSYSRNIKDYSIKKCKNFGYTFSIIFSLLSIYNYYVVSSFFIPFVILTLSLFLLAKFHPQSFKFLGFYWEKLGYFLGKFFSPIILFLVYLITIIPINLLLRFLKVDILNKMKSNKIKSYWVEKKETEIIFKDQH